jgi:hypothetical protein
LRSLPLVDRRGVPRVDLSGGLAANVEVDDEPADAPGEGPLRPEESSEGALRSSPAHPGVAL